MNLLNCRTQCNRLGGYDLENYLVLLKLMSFEGLQLQVITQKMEGIKPNSLYDAFLISPKCVLYP